MIICKCNGCGKEIEAVLINKQWIIPKGWYQRDVSNVRTCYDYSDGSLENRTPSVIHLCSTECIDLAKEKYKNYLRL